MHAGIALCSLCTWTSTTVTRTRTEKQITKQSVATDGNCRDDNKIVRQERQKNEIAVERLDNITESMTGMVELYKRDEERKWWKKQEGDARRCWHIR